MSGLAEVETAEGKDAATLNKNLVESLVPGLKSADAPDLSDVISHLDSHGRCLLLLSLTVACQQGELA